MDDIKPAGSAPTPDQPVAPPQVGGMVSPSAAPTMDDTISPEGPAGPVAPVEPIVPVAPVGPVTIDAAPVAPVEPVKLILDEEFLHIVV